MNIKIKLLLGLLCLSGLNAQAVAVIVTNRLYQSAAGANISIVTNTSTGLYTISSTGGSGSFTNLLTNSVTLMMTNVVEDILFTTNPPANSSNIAANVYVVTNIVIQFTAPSNGLYTLRFFGSTAITNQSGSTGLGDSGPQVFVHYYQGISNIYRSELLYNLVAGAETSDFEGVSLDRSADGYNAYASGLIAFSMPSNSILTISNSHVNSISPSAPVDPYQYISAMYQIEGTVLSSTMAGGAGNTTNFTFSTNSYETASSASVTVSTNLSGRVFTPSISAGVTNQWRLDSTNAVTSKLQQSNFYNGTFVGSGAGLTNLGVGLGAYGTNGINVFTNGGVLSVGMGSNGFTTNITFYGKATLGKNTPIYYLDNNGDANVLMYIDFHQNYEYGLQIGTPLLNFHVWNLAASSTSTNGSRVSILFDEGNESSINITPSNIVWGTSAESQRPVISWSNSISQAGQLVEYGNTNWMTILRGGDESLLITSNGFYKTGGQTDEILFLGGAVSGRNRITSDPNFVFTSTDNSFKLGESGPVGGKILLWDGTFEEYARFVIDSGNLHIFARNAIFSSSFVGTNIDNGFTGNGGGLSNAVDIIAGSNITIVTNSNKRSFTISSTGGGSQTPWTSIIDAARFALTNASRIDSTNLNLQVGTTRIVLSSNSVSATGGGDKLVWIGSGSAGGLTAIVGDNAFQFDTSDDKLIIGEEAQGSGQLLIHDATHDAFYGFTTDNGILSFTGILGGDGGSLSNAVGIAAGSNITVITNANGRLFTISSTGGGGSGIITNGGTGIENTFSNLTVISGARDRNALLINTPPNGNLVSILVITNTSAGGIYLSVDNNGHLIANGDQVTNVTAAALNGPINQIVQTNATSTSSNYYAANTNTFVGRLLIPDGVVGSPSIQFSSDADGTGTGLYKLSANNLAFSVNGALQAYFGSSSLNFASAITLNFNGNAYIKDDGVNIFQFGIDSATPTAYTIKGTDGSGSNIRGGDVTLTSGRGTGTGSGGALHLAIGTNGVSSSNQGALSNVVTIGFSGLGTFTNRARVDRVITNWVVGTIYTNQTGSGLEPRRALVSYSILCSAGAAAGTGQCTLYDVSVAGVTNALTVSASGVTSLTNKEALVTIIEPYSFFWFADESSGTGSVAGQAGTGSWKGL